jgi:V-type H+-transporting ATPase subunit a
MKISLIFGVIHMSFGVLLSVWNKVNHRHYHSIILEFFPQFIFLLFIFGYLIFMIFLKWIMYGANKHGEFSEHCAPNLLITFINMMLMKSAVRVRERRAEKMPFTGGGPQPEGLPYGCGRH